MSSTNTSTNNSGGITSEAVAGYKVVDNRTLVLLTDTGVTRVFKFQSTGSYKDLSNDITTEVEKEAEVVLAPTSASSEASSVASNSSSDESTVGVENVGEVEDGGTENVGAEDGGDESDAASVASDESSFDNYTNGGLTQENNMIQYGSVEEFMAALNLKGNDNE